MKLFEEYSLSECLKKLFEKNCNEKINCMQALN